MWQYLLVLLGSFLVDCVPIVAPPAWMWMLFMMTKYDLNPWIVVTFGTCGTVSGRYVFSQFVVPWVGRKTLGKKKNADLKFVGKKLSGKGWSVFSFVFLYSLLPLSTTALFTAAGLAKVKKAIIIPPFFLGNFIGDAIYLISGKYVITSASQMYKGFFNVKNIVLMIVGLGIILLMIVIDWRSLLEKKKLRLKWKFWA